MKITIQFEAYEGGNILYDLQLDGRSGTIIRATWPVPEGASDYYGYITAKHAIISNMEAHGISPEITWWYDTDDGLPTDAEADMAVSIEIDYDALSEND